MNKQIFKDIIGWGLVLWMIGYVLGIVLFMLVPLWVIGWIIMPIGIAITLWILVSKIKTTNLRDYLLIGIGWTWIAVVLDYFLLVKLFQPADGYYKLDVYLYYLATFILPLLVGWKKARLATRRTKLN